MRSLRMRGAGLLPVLLAWAMAADMARADTIVVPNDLASEEGNGDNSFPFNIAAFGATSQRYQQVYGASQFPAGPLLITALTFRPDSFLGDAFSSTLPNVQINLSTTSAAPDALSLTFANNVGSNDTVVFSGALSLFSTDVPGPGNTRAFDIVINLQTPFLFDPAAGNLLLDVRNFEGGSTTWFDAHGLPGDPISRTSTFATGSVDSPTAGFADSFGLVTQFTVTPIPEPSTVTLLGLGALGLISYGWRRRQRAA